MTEDGFATAALGLRLEQVLIAFVVDRMSRSVELKSVANCISVVVRVV